MLQLDIQKADDTVDWFALENILKELGFPNKFTRWLMVAVTTVSYRLNIGGMHTITMKARRSLKQGDPICHILFIAVMEYLHRSMHKLSKIPDLNFHAKCEKLQIVNISFTDDLLLFARGDCNSIELLMENMNYFSKPLVCM